MCRKVVPANQSCDGKTGWTARTQSGEISCILCGSALEMGISLANSIGASRHSACNEDLHRNQPSLAKHERSLARRGGLHISIMSKTRNALATFVLATVSLLAAAGPDFDAIERSRSQARKPQPQPTTNLPSQPGEVKQEAKVCAVEKPILPLDHGPRAQTTPYENAVRMRKYQEEVAKKC